MFEKKSEIPLDQFIYKALYHPKKGYYMKNMPFGKDGDFITAPNISKIFSEMVFLWLISYWEKFHKNKKINVVELGAGNGELINQIIKSAEKFKYFSKSCNFIIYEKSNKLINLQKKKLKNCKVKWQKNLDQLKYCPTIFIGNEFLDALPIKQFIKSKNLWKEIYVKRKQGVYSFTEKKCNMQKIENQLNIKITKKQKFLEISFEAIEIIKKLNKIISKNDGCILLIDYAYLNYEMHNTLQGVKRHKSSNILKDVGNTDITHILNIPFLKKISKNLNLELDYITQGEFLIDLGILKRAEILASKKKFLEKANIFYRVNRLIDKKQMGDLFKVMHFHKKNRKFKLGFK